ncbi:hypothetical protein F01_420064 [Burkholderia cenocepacia]|nr:hypothetical protein F01_420064 [Burkholderia cenocepacia]
MIECMPYVIPTAPDDSGKNLHLAGFKPSGRPIPHVNDYPVQESIRHGRQKTHPGRARCRGNRRMCTRWSCSQHHRLAREYVRHARRARRQRRARDVGRPRRRDLHGVDVGRG